MKKDLTYEEVAAVCSYNPETGAVLYTTRKPSKKSKTSGKYLQIMLYGTSYLQHRVAWLLHYKVWPRSFINHINGAKDDNRIVNLEDVSQFTNMNSYKRLSNKNTSGYKNVSYDSTKQKWTASRTYYGKSYFVGDYATAEEANTAMIEFNKTLNRENEITEEVASTVKANLLKIGIGKLVMPASTLSTYTQVLANKLSTKEIPDEEDLPGQRERYNHIVQTREALSEIIKSVILFAERGEKPEILKERAKKALQQVQ